MNERTKQTKITVKLDNEEIVKALDVLHITTTDELKKVTIEFDTHNETSTVVIKYAETESLFLYSNQEGSN